MEAVALVPIPTHYAGVLFRSRKEARWAVFFDELGVRWEYEPEGFQLPSGARYLPDFRLPDLRAWFEVKGDECSEGDRARWMEFAEYLPDGWRAFLHYGDMTPDPYGGSVLSIEMAGPWNREAGEGNWDAYYAWCACPSCGSVFIQFEGRCDRIACRCVKTWRCRGLGYAHPSIVAAYAAARSRRMWEAA